MQYELAHFDPKQQQLPLPVPDSVCPPPRLVPVQGRVTAEPERKAGPQHLQGTASQVWLVQAGAGAGGTLLDKHPSRVSYVSPLIRYLNVADPGPRTLR
jgi:hypothetical protein